MKQFLLLIFLCFCTLGKTQTVTAVNDGDSWVIQITDSVKQTVRLIGFDSPEKYSPPYVLKAQPMGKEIGDSLRSIFKGKLCTFETFGLDTYGRVLAKIKINGLDISEYVLSRGWGWYLTTPVKADRKKYRQLRDYAKKNKLGLWADPFAIEPKKWRKQFTNLTNKTIK